MHDTLRPILTHWLPSLTVSMLLAGCIDFSSIEHPHQIYVLQAPTQQILPPHTCRADVLRVANTWSTSFDDRSDLVYSRQPDTRGHYRYAQWSALPDVRFNQLLFTRLLADRIDCTTIDARSNANADLNLTTELLDFYHDAATPPGQVVVRVSAELYDLHTHRLIARHTFSVTQPASRFSAAGAAKAFNQATGQLLDDLSVWLDNTSKNNTNSPSKS